MDAQYYLGMMYYKGRGLPKDSAEAMKWYRKAAEQGHAEAQFNLGSMFANGQGVPKDYTQSYFWFNLVASRESGEENRKASAARGRVAKQLTREQLQEAQRLAGEWEGAHRGK